ncbi:MAG: hypothetical protein A2W23_04930 [Planctomycetes bacterium RBG_16_43_13]|nr:MAG: hypothetical protein A2W23_04930 [Planctomycetes bacterium RBG_16_43_13]
MIIDNFLHSTVLFRITLILYLLSSLFLAASFIIRSKGFTKLAVLILFSAFLANTAVIAERWVVADRAPFKTLYETMIFYPWCVCLVFFILLLLYRLVALGIFSSAICLIGFVYACYKPDIEIINMPPALQSGWFVPHVVTYFISYAALFASFSLAILYLILPNWRKEDSNVGFEEFYNRSMNFGFVALTLGLVMGAIWGKVAWGDYWSWDPKENWALITWFAYLAAIHLRYVSGWKGKRLALVCIAGFCAVVFTYLGMSILPTASGSLHVYQ